jgi:cytochrome c oxidase cbb3-type subunit 3
MQLGLGAGLVSCLLAGAGVVVGGGAEAADPPDKVSEATIETYKTKCQACHMPEGNAPLEMMNLADANWRHGSRPEDIAKVIKDGVPNTAMLPFKAQLSAAEIAALAAYVRSFDKTLKPVKAKK